MEINQAAILFELENLHPGNTRFAIETCLSAYSLIAFLPEYVTFIVVGSIIVSLVFKQASLIASNAIFSSVKPPKPMTASC